MTSLIRPPDAWGVSVAMGPCGGLYLIREVPADWGRGWAVCRLAARSGYHVHLSDAGVGECECKAFLIDDHCKHVRMVCEVLSEEGRTVSLGLPDGWKNHPLRPGLPPLPPQIQALPVAANGYPVPWFVAWVNGQPEFRAAEPKKLLLAIRERRCWVCGMGIPQGPATFVVGPMCTANLVSSEPPSHHQCAVFSATACPFLTKPHMVRRENDLPAHSKPAGVSIDRNPGVTALWTSGRWEVMRAGDGILFHIGIRPAKVEWFAEGRPATRAEVEASFKSGCGALLDIAKSQGVNAPREVAEVERKLKEAEKWWPVDPRRMTQSQIEQAGAT